jgi:transcriptional regulator with XRE-family HTH domain
VTQTHRLTDEQLAALRAAPVNERVPNRVRVAMALAGVRQEDVIAATGINRYQLSRIVNGRLSNFELATVQPLASFFGCATDDLFPAQAEQVA